MFCFLALCAVASLAAQQVLDFDTVQPSEEYGNVHVQQLYSDSAVTAFMIWVKKEVAPHYHAKHTEQVYILEGRGTMTMGGKAVPVKAGDHIFIPPGTVHSVKVTSEAPMKVLSIQAPEFDGTDRIWVEE